MWRKMRNNKKRKYIRKVRRRARKAGMGSKKIRIKIKKRRNIKVRRQKRNENKRRDKRRKKTIRRKTKRK